MPVTFEGTLRCEAGEKYVVAVESDHDLTSDTGLVEEEQQN